MTKGNVADGLTIMATMLLVQWVVQAFYPNTDSGAVFTIAIMVIVGTTIGDRISKSIDSEY